MSRYTELTDDGAWCWFQDPRAVRYSGATDRTFTGWVTKSGDIVVGSYDHETGSTNRTVVHESFERDDHDAPTFHIDAAGRLLVFYTGHGGPTIRYRRSIRTASIDTFHPEQVIEPSESHTYPNPRRIGDTLYLFYRNANGSLAYVVSEDDGRTWSEELPLVTTAGREWCVYFRISEVVDERVDIGLTFAEGGESDPHRDIRHLRFDGERLLAADSGVVADADAVPVEFWTAPAIYESDRTGHDAWVWDCSLASGDPEVVYAVFRFETDHVYQYARWTGSSWTNTKVCNAGSYITAGGRENYYSGGISLDHDRPGVCYCSVGDSEGSALERYEIAADGEVGDIERLTTTDDQNVRPVVPWNRHDQLPVLWMHGSYNHYRGTEYETGIIAAGPDSAGPKPSSE